MSANEAVRPHVWSVIYSSHGGLSEQYTYCEENAMAHQKQGAVVTPLYTAAAQPDGTAGMVLVPRQPTSKMLNAGWAQAEDDGNDPEQIELATIYAAMIDAAPKVAP